MMRTFFILLASAAFLSGCESSSAIETDKGIEGNAEVNKSAKATAKSGTLILATTMTDKGVECSAVQDVDQQQLYTIEDMPSDFDVGARLNIHVIYPIEPVASFCQQGQTIIWTRIELVSPGGVVLNYWDK